MRQNLFNLSIILLLAGCLNNQPAGDTYKADGLTSFANYLLNDDLDYQAVDQKAPDYNGKAGAKFEIRDGDCIMVQRLDDCPLDYDRNEQFIALKKGKNTIKYALFIPKKWVNIPNFATFVGQIDQLYQDKKLYFGQSYSVDAPAIQLLIENNNLYFGYYLKSGSAVGFGSTFNKVVIGSLDKWRNQWLDIQIDFDTENPQKPAILYFNGTQRASIPQIIKNRQSKEYIFRYGIARDRRQAKQSPDPYISDGNLRNKYRQYVFYGNVSAQ